MSSNVRKLDHKKSQRGLSEAQVAVLEHALKDDWSIDRHVTYEENLALLVSSLNPDTEGRSFYIDAGDTGLNLSIMQDDDLRLHGCYEDVEALLMAIRLIS